MNTVQLARLSYQRILYEMINTDSYRTIIYRNRLPSCIKYHYLARQLNGILPDRSNPRNQEFIV
jgi:hypothetical protein